MRRIIPTLALAAATPMAAADVLIGNLGATDVSATAFGSGTTTIFKAAGLTMNDQSFTLDEVVLRMEIQMADSQPRVSIWEGDTSGPTSELIELDNPPLSIGLNNWSFTPPAPFTLEANETYWIYVEAATSGNFRWISTNVDPSGPHASHVGYNFNGSPSTFRNKYNLNGTPAMDCPIDFDGNGVVDVTDFFIFLDLFAAGDDLADLNGDGEIAVDDFFMFLDLFPQGCP